MNATSIFLPAYIFLSSHLSAATVAHWEFNEVNGFDETPDSSGNGYTLTDNNTVATISGGQANFSATTANSGLLSTPNNAAWSDTTFTIESKFTYQTNASISTIAAHLSSSTGRQWLLGITGGAPYLILKSGSTESNYITSTFGSLTNGRTYYFGAAVNLAASDAADRITFYFKDITGDGELLSEKKSTSFTSLATSTAPLTIGSTAHESSGFLGSIDEVRFSDTPLASNQLLVPEPSQLLLSLAGISLLAVRRKR